MQTVANERKLLALYGGSEKKLGTDFQPLEVGESTQPTAPNPFGETCESTQTIAPNPLGETSESTQTTVTHLESNLQPEADEEANEPTVERPMPGTALPRTGGLSTGEILAMISNPSDNIVHDNIPPGVKENVYFLVDNKRNIERVKVGKNNAFEDDCGAWSAKTKWNKHPYLIDQNKTKRIHWVDIILLILYCLKIHVLLHKFVL